MEDIISLVVVGAILLIFIVLCKGYFYERFISNVRNNAHHNIRNNTHNQIYAQVNTPTQINSTALQHTNDVPPQYEV